MDAVSEEERHHNPFLGIRLPSFQFRSEVSRAIWDENLGLGEIIEKKGGIWTSTGVTRNNGKLYCTLEEIIFYMERGALFSLDGKGKILDLKYMYMKLAEGGYGCNWESLEVYRHLRSLGYIVKRCDVPWTIKRDKGCSPESSCVPKAEKVEKEDAPAPIIEMIKRREINGLKLDFDVYLPNSKFRKTSPGDPHFILSLISGEPPSRLEIESLEEKCEGLPLKFCHVDNGRVSIFSLGKINLEVLP